MSHSRSEITAVIVTGFDDAHTASLANAALARLHEELGLAMNDVAMIIRSADGKIAVQQTLGRNAGRNESSTFWETLADQLFAPESSTGTATEAASGKGAAVGIDPTSASRIANQLRLCKSALLVRAGGLAQSEKVVGVLRGFDGELVRVPFQF
jgi:uncharacterized membrane protein